MPSAGHLFALGETRDVARRNMIMALRELSIRGDIRTTIEYLPHVMEVRMRAAAPAARSLSVHSAAAQTQDFINNKTDTRWLERVSVESVVKTEKPAPHLAAILGAARPPARPPGRPP